MLQRIFAVLVSLSIVGAMAAQGQSSLKPTTAAAASVTSIESAKIASAAEAMHARLVSQRRDFHMHPELSNREERTSRVVAERLKAIGFTDIRTGVGKYGVVAVLKGGKPGPVVAVRADMDALP